MVGNGKRRRETQGGPRRKHVLQRGKIEMAVMKMSFKRVLVRNNSVCPYCSRVVADNCDRKTFIKHMDSACCPKENQPLRENLAIDSCATIENENEESGDSEMMPETEANDMGEDAVDGSVSDTPLEQSWEQDFRDIENPIQKRGARQTGAQVRENLDKNIGTKGMTLAKVLYNILEKDRPVHVIEDILSVSRMVCSKPGLLPTSFHVVRRALEMRSLASVDVHICKTCQQFAWKPQPKASWPDCPPECTCQECTCPVCLENGASDSKRFEERMSESIEPRMRCYYFGLEHQINAMYSIKEFRESRKGLKPFNKPGSWWSSQHVRWINGRTGGEATETNDIPIEEGLGEAFLPNNGVYSLHFDWVQVTRIGKKPYSVGLIVLRCDDVEESKLNTDAWAMPLMVIPGPDEPRCMDIHWEIIRSQFYDYSEGDQEMNVSYREDGILHEFVHKPFLVRVCCDAMARHKIMCSRPAASLHTCPWCWVESSSSERSKVFGYAKPIQHQVFNWDDFLQMRHSDIKPIRTQDIHIGITPESEYKVTLEEHKRRSEILDTLNRSRVSTSFKVTAKKHLGLSGKSHISWGLKALHPLQFVYLPMYHLLFLGIVKDFLKHIFRPDKALAPVSDVMAPNKSNFKEFASARERIILNSDIAEECISLDNMHGWLIAPLIAFVEVHSCFLFNEEVSGFNLLSKPCKRAWGFLRRAVMYFLRDTEDPFDADTIQILRENARRDLDMIQSAVTKHIFYWERVFRYWRVINYIQMPWGCCKILMMKILWQAWGMICSSSSTRRCHDTLVIDSRQ